MLILTRRVGETVMIGNEVTVTVLGVKGNQVRVGVNAPKDVAVHREEIYERIKREEDHDSQSGAPIAKIVDDAWQGRRLDPYSFTWTAPGGYHPALREWACPNRRGGRVVEGAPLLRAYGSKAHRGFESLPLRQTASQFLSVSITQWCSNEAGIRTRDME